MPKNLENVLYQDKYHRIVYSNVRKHSLVVMRPIVRVIIHNKNKDDFLILQETWENDFGYFLLEDILYQDVQENGNKTQEETLKDALEIATNICKWNGIVPKNLKLLMEDFIGRIHCTYYYFLVTDFQEIKVETEELRYWMSVNEILELVKKKAFYDEDAVGIFLTYLLKENFLVYNVSER